MQVLIPYSSVTEMSGPGGRLGNGAPSMEDILKMQRRQLTLQVISTVAAVALGAAAIWRLFKDK